MNQRPFNCCNCNNTFTRKHHLERHLNTHDNLTRKQIANYLDKFKNENTQITKLIKSNFKLKFKINFNMDFEDIETKQTIEEIDIKTILEPDIKTILEPDIKTILEPVIKTILEPVKKVEFYAGSKRKITDNDISKDIVYDSYKPNTETVVPYTINTKLNLSSLLCQEQEYQYVEVEEEQPCCKNLSDFEYIMHFKYDHKYNH